MVCGYVALAWQAQLGLQVHLPGMSKQQSSGRLSWNRAGGRSCVTADFVGCSPCVIFSFFSLHDRLKLQQQAQHLSFR
jgi:hypothetical protein